MGKQAPVDVVGFLVESKQKAPAELKESFAKFQDLYERKLWHQLTVALEQFVAIPSSRGILKSVYDSFVSQWELKMNQLKLVNFVVLASRTLASPKEAADFLSAHEERLKDKTEWRDAYVVLSAEIANYKLLVGDEESTLATIKACSVIVDELQGVDPIVHATYYRVAAGYYKFKANFPQYYKNALLYLSSVQLDQLSKEEQVERARDLALAGILSEGVYNFDELLMHQVLDSLKGTSYEWLYELLRCYNTGDMDKFEKLAKSEGFQKDPLLTTGFAFIKSKLCLMTLTDLIFRLSQAERGKIPFSLIAKEVKIPHNQVELLVIKALSLGLIRGSINQVTETVSVPWVHSRVLDKEHLTVIKNRLKEWSEKVKSHVEDLEKNEKVEETFIQ